MGNQAQTIMLLSSDELIYQTLSACQLDNESIVICQNDELAGFIIDTYDVDLFVLDKQSPLSSSFPSVLITKESHELTNASQFTRPAQASLPRHYLSAFTLRQAIDNTLDKEAIHRVYTHEMPDVSQGLKRHAALAEIEMAFNRPFEKHALLMRIVQIATDSLTNNGYASVILWDAETETFYDSVSIDTSIEPHKLVRQEKGASRKIVAQKTILVTEIDDLRFPRNSNFDGIPHSHSMGVPMLNGDDVIGVLYAVRNDTVPFSDEDLSFGKMLANSAATAISRVQLFAQLEAKNAESENAVVQLQELDRLKSQFINDVSHELRTPVTNMSLYIDLLERGNPDKQAQYIKTLRTQSGRVVDLIDKVLSLSRIDMGKLSPEWVPTDLNELILRIADIYQTVAQETGVSLTATLSPNLPPIFGEGNQMALVIDNLISNAFLYTQEGEIIVETGFDDTKMNAVLTVSDTGMGIKEIEMPYIFDRFYRGEMMSHANIPGSGLGLAIVDEIVRMHNGSVEVESVVDQGTTFRVLLPLAAVPVPQEPTPVA